MGGALVNFFQRMRCELVNQPRRNREHRLWGPDDCPQPLRL